jgi:hypothetical protein
MKLKRSRRKGELSNYCSGVTWEIVELGSEYSVQSFSEYYGAHQEIRVYDTKKGPKIASFHCGLQDLRKKTKKGLEVFEFIKQLKEKNGSNRSES